MLKPASLAVLDRRLLYLFPRFHSLLFSSILLANIATSFRFSSIRFHSLLFHSLPFTSLPFASIRFHSLPFASIRFHSLPFASIRFFSLQRPRWFCAYISDPRHLPVTVLVCICAAFGVDGSVVCGFSVETSPLSPLSPLSPILECVLFTRLRGGRYGTISMDGRRAYCSVGKNKRLRRVWCG